MNDLNTAFSKENLLRAWRWINSNPSYFYKNLFRDSISAYSISSNENINDLYKRLKSNTYKPTEASLMLLPKSNCTTRPYTLLALEDQIVYQALVNIIAEKYEKLLSKNYHNITFGNMYAGKRSVFFYRQWGKGYTSFNNAIKRSFNQGYTVKASFDLASCYDSIDHKVLGNLLHTKGLDKEFVDYLLILLSHWSTNTKFYKSHGIPQGPMSSGLLAEVFLSFFDEKFIKNQKNGDIRYFRYVDDIVLMGKDERKLTRLLAALDYYSKQIGLFPQTSKIEIVKLNKSNLSLIEISEIEQTISHISGVDTTSLERKIKTCIDKKKVISKTEFKMYVNSVAPNSKLSLYLLDILEYNPQYYSNICYYLSRYDRKISDKVVIKLLSILNREDVYQIIGASILETIYYNISDKMSLELILYCKNKLKKKKILTPYNRYVIMKVLLFYRKISYVELKKLLNNEKDWWVKKSIFKYIEMDVYGEASYHEIVRILTNSNNNEVSLASVSSALENNISFIAPYTNINYFPQITLKYVGAINRAARQPTMIEDVLNRIAGKTIKKYNWKLFFEADHDDCEKRIIRALSYSQSDMSSFVNIMDTFNDFLLSKLFSHDGSIGGYELGKIGSSLNGTSRFAIKYPKLYDYVNHIHELRLGCDLSHPKIKRTRKYTRPIQYKEIYKIRRIMIDGLTELIDILTL